MTHLLSLLCWLSAGLYNIQLPDFSGQLAQLFYSSSGWLHSNVQQTATWLSRGSALSLTHAPSSQLARSPSTSWARVCWAAAMMVSLHQLSKDLLSCCYCDTARCCWVWLLLHYVHTGRLSTRVTESASPWDTYTETGKRLNCWSTRFLSAWILISLKVIHQRVPSSVVSLAKNSC